MAINLENLMVPLAVGAMTGVLVVSLVLKNFTMRIKLEIACAGAVSAAVVAVLYYASQNIAVGVVLGTSWAMLCLYFIAERVTKTIPNMNAKAEPLELLEENAGNLAAVLIAVIAFILGVASTLFKNPGDKFNLVAFSAPPLISSISMAVCMYFATKYRMTNNAKEKQYYMKRSLVWWDIGQTIFIATTITMILFVAMSIEKVVA